MKFLKELKKKISKEIEHEPQEVYDLKTGAKVKIVKVRQPDGTFTIKKVEDTEMPEEQSPDKGSIEESIELPVDAPKPKKKATPAPAGKVDLVALLDDNISKISTIKDERDTLLQEVLTLRSKIKEAESHKSAKADAEEKLVELEGTVTKLKDENSDLEETVSRLKEERNAVEEKLKKYEAVLLKVKDRVLDLNNLS